MGMIQSGARKAGRETYKKTKCGFLPQVMEFFGKDIEREFGTKTREFYEFVLPPVDMRVTSDQIQVTVDVPGFVKDQIKINMDGRILTVSAKREKVKGLAYAQRPNVIEKRIRLPARIRRGEEPECTAALQEGVLTISIPVRQTGKSVSID